MSGSVLTGGNWKRKEDHKRKKIKETAQAFCPVSFLCPDPVRVSPSRQDYKRRWTCSGPVLTSCGWYHPDDPGKGIKKVINLYFPAVEKVYLPTFHAKSPKKGAFVSSVQRKAL